MNRAATVSTAAIAASRCKQLNTEVLSISRRAQDKLRMRLGQMRRSCCVRCPDGGEEEILAPAGIDASGTWRTPNPLGAGVVALGEAAAADDIPDVLGHSRARYVGKRVLVSAAVARRSTCCSIWPSWRRAIPRPASFWSCAVRIPVNCLAVSRTMLCPPVERSAVALGNSSSRARSSCAAHHRCSDGPWQRAGDWGGTAQVTAPSTK